MLNVCLNNAAQLAKETNPKTETEWKWFLRLMLMFQPISQKHLGKQYNMLLPFSIYCFVKKTKQVFLLDIVDQYIFIRFIRKIRIWPYELSSFQVAGNMFIKMSEMMWLTSEGSSQFFCRLSTICKYVCWWCNSWRTRCYKLTTCMMDAIRHVGVYQWLWLVCNNI